MPTFIDVGKTNYPTTFKGNTIYPITGRSLAPVFMGDTLRKHEYMFWEHEGWQAVRKGNWKAVKDKKGTTWSLYDLLTDRSEEHNLASVETGILNDLVKHWNEWAKEDYVFPKHADKNITTVE